VIKNQQTLREQLHIVLDTELGLNHEKPNL
jgi:hypothetical protein